MQTRFLSSLVHELIRRDFHLGIDQIILAHTLLRNLSEIDTTPADNDSLAIYLASIFCKSSDEEVEFRHVFYGWVAQESSDLFGSSPGTGGYPPPKPNNGKPFEESPPTGEKPPKSRSLRYQVALAAILVVMVVFVSILTKGPYQKASNSNASNANVLNSNATPRNSPNVQAERIWSLANTSIYAAIILFITFLFSIFIRRFFKKLTYKAWLEKRASQSPRFVHNLPVYLGRATFLPAWKGLVNQLGSVLTWENDLIDLKKTIEASINRGVLTYAYRSLKPASEYLVLITSRSHNDQQALLVKGFCSLLDGSNVITESFWAYKDHGLFRRTDFSPEFYSLEKLIGLYPNYNLIFVGDNLEVLDCINRHRNALISHPNIWPKRAIISDRRVEPKFNQFIRDVGIKSITLDDIRLNRLTEILYSGKNIQDKVVSRTADPEIFESFANRWLVPHRPSQVLVDTLLSELKLHLGPKTFEVLSASAVYPRLYFELSLYLAHVLESELSGDLDLAKLLTLPWFRHGSMPDWLRHELISVLDMRTSVIINQSLSELLLTAVSSRDGLKKKLVLDIGFPSEPNLGIKRFLRKPGSASEKTPQTNNYLKSPDNDSVLNDEVWLTFTRDPKKLNFSLPEELARKLRGRKTLGREYSQSASPESSPTATEAEVKRNVPEEQHDTPKAVPESGMTRRESHTLQITKGLSRLQAEMELRNTIQLYDLDIRAEYFYRDFLKLVYDWNLESLNVALRNATFIDLVDKKNSIVIQITSRNDAVRIRDMIHAFFADPKNKGTKLKVLLIGKGLTNYRVDLTAGGEHSFDANRDIIDTSKLLSDINQKSPDELERISEFLTKELLRGEFETSTPTSPAENTIGQKTSSASKEPSTPDAETKNNGWAIPCYFPLCYIGGLCSLFVLVAYRNDNRKRFHAIQSLLFGLIYTIIYFGWIVIGDVKGSPSVIGPVVFFLVNLVASMYGMIRGYQGHQFRFPVIGDLAARWSIDRESSHSKKSGINSIFSNGKD